MSGLFGGGGSTPAVVQPTAPVLSNAGSNNFTMIESAMKQNSLLLKQMQDTQNFQMNADMAEAESMRELELREAKAEAEMTERKRRMSKGKKDLLYANALGVVDDDDEGDLTDRGLLALGGDI